MLNKIKLRVVVYSSLLIFMVIITIISPLIVPVDPIQIDMGNRLASPNSDNIFGTDNLGRDLFSRTLCGGRTSIAIAVMVASLSMCLGLILGLLSGYFGGTIDVLITMISNIFQGLPSMTLMIVLVAVLEPSNQTLIIVLTITSWVGFSRYVRSETIKVRSKTYIESLQILGASNLRIMLKGIFPNILSGCLVLYTTRIGRVVISISSLSYLGIGIQPPTPDWGKMISEANQYIRTDPHLFIAPAICIMLFSCAINLLGDAMRDYFDVKSQATQEV